MNVTSSTTTLTLPAPLLPDGVFTDTVVVVVTAINQHGVGPDSNSAIAEIRGNNMHLHTQYVTYTNILYVSLHGRIKGKTSTVLAIKCQVYCMKYSIVVRNRVGRYHKNGDGTVRF